MYARRVKDKTLTFAVSGKLWQFSLVMIDRETETLWSHLLGRGMRGPLIDTELKVVPSVMTDWKTWRTTHPETTVVKMSRTSQNYRRGLMQGEDSRILIGMTKGKQARAWRIQELRKVPTVNEVVFSDKDGSGGIPVIVAYDEERGTVVIYNRKVGDRTLTFHLEKGMLQDAETRSKWDLLTGVAKTGPLKGKRLSAEIGIVSLQDGWHDFHRKSSYWRAPKTGPK